MHKITLIILILFSQVTFAQFPSSDVKYFVGTGAKTAYLSVDFNDAFSSNSYVWGYRFDDLNLTMEDLINAIAADEPSFNVEIQGGFLYSLNYNQHNPSTDDYWSTWSGNASNDLSMNLGINNDPLIDGKWYGLSYGFPEDFDFEPSHPREPIPAYSSQWFLASQITNWIGTGLNQSLVVIDFGTNTNQIADSYAFGIKYNGEISANQALQLIQNEVSYYDFTSTENQIATLNLGAFSGNTTETNSWSIYKGTNLSDWSEKANLSQVVLSNNEWLGLSFAVRRPFKPQEATSSLSNNKHNKLDLKIYPNPASDVLNIQSQDELTQVEVYNIQGQRVLQITNATSINISSLQAGVYILKAQSNKGFSTVKFIKK